MKKIAWIMVALILILGAGCGGGMAKHAKSGASYSSDENMAEQGVPPPAPAAEMASGGGYSYPMADGEMARPAEPAPTADYGGDQKVSDSPSGVATSAPPPPPPLASPAPQQQGKVRGKGESPDSPMVVYSGYLKLRVKRLLDAMDELTKIAETRGGYVESLTERVIVLRVPRGDFEATMAALSAVGVRLAERVSALDVTEQFTDLGTRLAVAKEARERLLVLLKNITDVEERLRIVQEIKRLTEQIEYIESTLRTIRNLVDFFTITIELEPVIEDRGAQVQRSPFEWIQNLLAHMTTIVDGKNDISMTLPKGFVLFEDDDSYRAQAADTTVIRGGVVENEPRGNNTFWSAAVQHEMEGRGEILVEEGKAGKLSYRLYKSEDVQPRYYLVAVHAINDDLYVIEVFYPNEDSYKAHHADVVAALKTFEVK